MCMSFRHEFSPRHRFILSTSQDSRRSEKHRVSDRHRGHPLGQSLVTYPQMAGLIARGAEVRSTLLTDSFGWAEYQAQHGQRALLLFARDPNGRLHIASPEHPLSPASGWTVIALIEDASEPVASRSETAQALTT